MAYEALKGLMSEIALRKMAQRTPQARADLRYSQLRNQQLVTQIEKMVPLQIKNLEQQLDAFLKPAEQQALELQKAEILSKLKMNEEAYTQALRGAREAAKEEAKTAGKLEVEREKGRIQEELSRYEMGARGGLQERKYTLEKELKSMGGGGERAESTALQRQRERLWQEYVTGSPLTEAGVAPTIEELAKAQADYFDSGRLPVGWTSEKKAPVPERYTAGQAEGLAKSVQTWISANLDKLPGWVKDDFYDWQADDPEGALNALLMDDKVKLPNEIKASIEKLRAYYQGQPATGGFGLSEADLRYLEEQSKKGK